MYCTIAIPKFREGLLRIYMQSKYTASLRRAGARAVWIETDDLDKAIAQMLQCDGLLLSGGEDINPHFYDQAPSEKCGRIVPRRDHAEMKMLEAFWSTGKPILGICRGEQLLNVFFGGSLHQDIAHLVRCSHKDFSRKNQGNHPVAVEPGSRLEGIVQQRSLRVNSLHHQAVDRLGCDLVASAHSEDGIVEAIEHTTHPFCMGLQWHPEHMSPFCPTQQRIFNEFVRACRERSA